jgi:hypothetical protein
MIGGTVFCALLTACERTGELRRAEEWTRACQDFAARRLAGKFPVLHAHCRLAYGTVLCDAGHWPEAEAEMLEALGPSATACVPKMAEAAGALATLRLLQGRLDEAAELLAPHADRFEVCEPSARLHLARGDYDVAAAEIERGLHDLVGDRLRAGRLLSLLVQVELARGDINAADRAAERLSDYASDSDSAVLRAEAGLADGRIARQRGNPEAAIAALRSAREEMGDDQRPLLAAALTLELAGALSDADDAAAATAEGRAALACYRRLGAVGGAEQAAALLQQLGVDDAGGRP